MVDYVFEQKETSTIDTDQIDWYYMEVQKIDKMRNYANFLKQPLELWMFVPCNEEGGVLEEPDGYSSFEYLQQYQKAKERCLFEGFFNTTEAPQYKMYIQNGMQSVFYITRNSNAIKNIYGMKIIEDLIKENPVKLTQTAIRQIS